MLRVRFLLHFDLRSAIRLVSFSLSLFFPRTVTNFNLDIVIVPCCELGRDSGGREWEFVDMGEWSSASVSVTLSLHLEMEKEKEVQLLLFGTLLICWKLRSIDED